MPFHFAAGPEGSPPTAMQITGMWPYWLDGRSPATVRNTFEMSSMFLLTGELPTRYCQI